MHRDRAGRLVRLKLEGAPRWHRVSALAPNSVRRQLPSPGQHVTLALDALGLILALTVDGYGVGVGYEDARAPRRGRAGAGPAETAPPPRPY